MVVLSNHIFLKILLFIDQNVIFMKSLNYIFLIIGVFFILGFVNTFFSKNAVHQIFFFEVNIWIYRIWEVIMASVFIMFFFQKRGK